MNVLCLGHTTSGAMGMMNMVHRFASNHGYYVSVEYGNYSTDPTGYDLVWVSDNYRRSNPDEYKQLCEETTVFRRLEHIENYIHQQNGKGINKPKKEEDVNKLIEVTTTYNGEDVSSMTDDALLDAAMECVRGMTEARADVDGHQDYPAVQNALVKKHAALQQAYEVLSGELQRRG